MNLKGIQRGSFLLIKVNFYKTIFQILLIEIHFILL